MQRVPGPADPETPEFPSDSIGGNGSPAFEEAGASDLPSQAANLPLAPLVDEDGNFLAPPDLRPLHRRARVLPQPTRQGSRAAAIVGLIAVLGALGFVIGELRPDLLFGSGVDVGGDNGGHIAAPYFLIHDLLSQGRLTGWDPWWFDGFPLYVFYFPLPALLVAFATAVMPYAVAFKLVTVLGSVTLPIAGYIFGRSAGFRRPVPVLMAVATVPFLFNTSYTIDGGNLASTMAGEFSFSLAVTTGLFFLATVAYALRTGKLRWLAAVLFAVTCVCHVIPALAFGATALLMALATLRPRTLTRALRIIVPIGVVGALLAAWWLIPFAADLQYSSSMNYSPVGGGGWFHTNFLPDGYLFMLIPGVLGALISITARNRPAFVLALSAGLSVLAFHWLPSGLVYNARWLPFWFLYVSLLAAYALGEASRLLGRYVAPSGVASVAMTLGTVGAIIGSVFAGGLEGNGFLGFTTPAGHVQVSGWIDWNYSGLQARSGWPVFQSMVKLLDSAGKKYGCGRLQYEYLSETTNPFGSTEEMMSIPMWTSGCMQTTDGIYFESSTTTPFHFLDVSEVSQNGESPDPIAGLNYPGFDLADGVRHLQLMGVRYFLAMSPPVEALASTDPSLVQIGSAPSFPGPYNRLPVSHPHVVLYLIKNSALVVPLTHLPEVESTGKQAWLDVNLNWYEQEKYWPTLLARSGPATWPRARSGELVPPSRSVPATSTQISHIVPGTESISFHVSRTGTPVLVKVPYFPNWTASGATGPYEVSPNLMVVVPTSEDVTLTYGTSQADWAGKIASLVGVVGLGALVTMRAPLPAMPGPQAPSPGPSPALVPPVVEDSADETESEPDAEDGANEDGILDVSVVLPAHNEESLIAETVTTLVAALSGERFEIIIVENGSTDRTAEECQRLALEHPEVDLVRLIEADYGDALRYGFFQARGAAVVNFDVDYYDLGFLREAMSILSAGKAQIVLASKRAPGSADRRPLPRRVLTAGFTKVMRLLLEVPVSDAHGMKALDRRAIAPVVAASQMGGSVFDVEVVVRAHRSGLQIAELATEVHEVRPARTGVVRRSFEALRGLIWLRWIVGPAKPA
ncbi:MAG: glycosyltransferase [Acidimicrobiales bacterium]